MSHPFGHQARSTITFIGADETTPPDLEARVCRVCGCTEWRPCIGDDGDACHWIEWDLCSACALRPALHLLGAAALVLLGTLAVVVLIFFAVKGGFI